MKKPSDAIKPVEFSSRIDLKKQLENANREEFGNIFSDDNLDAYKKKVNDILNSTPDPSLSKTSYHLKPDQSSTYNDIQKDI